VPQVLGLVCLKIFGGNEKLLSPLTEFIQIDSVRLKSVLDKKLAVLLFLDEVRKTIYTFISLLTLTGYREFPFTLLIGLTQLDGGHRGDEPDNAERPPG